VPPVSESLRGREAGRSETPSHAEEARLVQACQRGDEAAFERLVELHLDRVFGLAYRLLQDYGEAEDTAQEVFLNCYRHIGDFRGESRLSTWLYRITTNLVKNRWKHQERREELKHDSLDAPRSEEDARFLDPPDPAPGPRERAQGGEIAQALNAAISSLAPDYQEVVALRFMENLSYDEIAEALGCSIGTVKSRINRARHLLRERIGYLLG